MTIKDEAKQLLAKINSLDEPKAMSYLVYKIGLIDTPDEYMAVILDLVVEYCDDSTPAVRRKKIYQAIVALLEVLS